MKTFDIELAKQGHPVWIMDNVPVKILSFESQKKDFPIVAEIKYSEEEISIHRYSLEGEWEHHPDKIFRLFMAELKPDFHKVLKCLMEFNEKNGHEQN